MAIKSTQYNSASIAAARGQSFWPLSSISSLTINNVYLI